MSDKIKKLPDSELEVMQVIWDCEAPVARTTIEEKMSEIHPMAQTTMLTLISRLAKKGFITAEKNGRSSEYTPLVKRDEYIAKESINFIQNLCGGSVSIFASALRESGLTREDLDELRNMLDKGEL